jgi:hypothetical protein
LQHSKRRLYHFKANKATFQKTLLHLELACNGAYAYKPVWLEFHALHVCSKKWIGYCKGLFLICEHL